MNRLVREPLVHFLLIGGLLFAVYARWGGRETAGESGGDILVTAARARHLAAAFERVWQRPPSRDELQGLIDDHVREEVYVREALKLGLDQDDTIIRRRLRQKLEFVSEDMFQAPTPTDDELAGFLKANPAWFTKDAEYTFRHVYFNTDRRGDAVERDALAALARLRAGDGEIEGDPPGDAFMLGQEFHAVTSTFVSRMFGDAFARKLPTLETGSWQGPVESGYGLHLVKVDSMTAGRLPALEEVREAVLAEWTDRKRAEANEAFYQSLKRKYTVTVEPFVAAGFGADPEEGTP